MTAKRAFWLLALVAGVLTLAGTGEHFRAQAASPDDEDVLPGKEPALPLEQPRQQIMRDKLVTWIKQSTTNQNVPAYVAKDIDQTLAKTNTFRYGIGANLNNTGKPYLVDAWDNRLYFFALSTEQAKVFDLKPNSTVLFAPTARQDAQRLATALVRLENLRFDSGTTIGSAAKVDGQVTLQTSNAPAGKYVLRLSYRRGSALVQAYHYLNELPSDGATIRFSFSALKGSDDSQKVSGPMPLYLDLCKVVRKDGASPITTIYSNTLPALVDVVAGGG